MPHTLRSRAVLLLLTGALAGGCAMRQSSAAARAGVSTQPVNQWTNVEALEPGTRIAVQTPNGIERGHVRNVTSGALRLESIDGRVLLDRSAVQRIWVDRPGKRAAAALLIGLEYVARSVVGHALAGDDGPLDPGGGSEQAELGPIDADDKVSLSEIARRGKLVYAAPAVEQ